MQERETASTRLTTDGYFAEYVLVDYQNAIILPKNLIIERAAPLFCAGINGTRLPYNDPAAQIKT